MFLKNATAHLIFVIFRLFLGILALFLVLALALPIGFYGMAMYIEPSLPKIDNLKTMPLEMPLQIYTADNKLIGQYGNRYSLPVTYDELPKPLIQAFLAAEDATFFEHSGISVKGLGRAITQMLTDSDEQTGGSSITQQVAKNYFLSPEQTFERKITEMFLARRIENEMSKDEILTLYVNKIYLGQGAYGIKAGARRYFSKSLQNLTIAEMAMLAGLPKAPSDFNPVVNPTRALERRNWIIGRMLHEGFITKEQHDEAINAPIGLNIYQDKPDLELPYISEMARDALVQMYGDKVMNSGWRVQLTIDSKDQLQAETALRNGLSRYHRNHGNYWGGIVAASGNLKDFFPINNNLAAQVTEVNNNNIVALLANGESITLKWSDLKGIKLYRGSKRPLSFNRPSDMFEVGNIIRVYQDGNNWRLSKLPIVQGALASINPSNGALIAVAGGYHFNQSKFNRATQGYRQPGSTIKPLVYAAALNLNKYSGPEAPISNEQIKGGWQPKGAGGGMVSMRSAVAYSKNLPVVHALRKVGIEPARSLMSLMGLERDRLPDSLPLALGAADATPLQMATAYSSFMNGGHRIQPYFIERIYTFHNDLVYQANPMQSCAICFNGALEKLNTSLARDFENAQQAKDTQAQNTKNQDNNKNSKPSDNESKADNTDETPTEPILDATPLHDRLSPKSAPVYSVSTQAPRILTPATAYNIADMLQDVVRYGTGKNANLGRSDIGGKTGTTNQAKDVWFAGVHPTNVAVVWMGFDNPASLGAGAQGGIIAAPIWKEFMQHQLKGVPVKYVEGGNQAKSEAQQQKVTTITDETPEVPPEQENTNDISDEGAFEEVSETAEASTETTEAGEANETPTEATDETPQE